MRLTVKNDKGVANDLRFKGGPVYIGRRVNANVFLPDPAISKEHAVIYMEQCKWIVKDLQSANKTFLNGTAIRKTQIRDGDVLNIGSFTITVSFDEDAEQEVAQEDVQAAAADKPPELEAMLSTPRDEVVVRNVDGSHAPAMRLAAKRLTEFSVITEAICDTDNIDDMMNVLVDIIMKQFAASCVWCGIKKQADAQITLQVGKRQNGDPVTLNDIQLSERITPALKRGRSLVMPQVAPRLEETASIRSALITAIKNNSGSYGALYVHNAMKQKHYSLSDLDYLMLIATHTAAVIKKYL